MKIIQGLKVFAQELLKIDYELNSKIFELFFQIISDFLDSKRQAEVVKNQTH
ncbi:hypothetical protein [Obesumbacterium proteus]|uniref:Uncharacterized protein n=1 Tax=Obesumbacterium proteus ATCC 12841 TaxID=1354268 RepID=A0AA91EEA6_9GAMM|nr:hypothetical protein [Obesumbacterium proteus]OAT58918.1 hypothetical protein M993_02221 [Obesumbacterium proteus ATCC 12841]